MRFPDFGTEGRKPFDRGFDGSPNTGLDPLTGCFGHDADPKAGYTVLEALRVVEPVAVQARGVAGILPAERGQQRRGVAHAPRQRADRVERGRERDQPVSADQTVGGLQTDDAAQRRRLTDAPAGVGPEGPDGLPGGDRGGAAAAGTAGDARGVPRVVHGSERRVLVGRAHRELVAVRLADEDRTVTGQASPRRAVVRRHVVLQDARGTGRPDAVRREDVLERRRDPGDARQRGARRAVHIELLRPLVRELRGARQERSDAIVDRVGAPQRRLQDLDGRDLATGELRRERRARQVAELRHDPISVIRGTFTRSPSRSGALRSASSTGSEGSGTSSRTTFARAIA